MVREDIETIIDRLYDYVNTNGKVSVNSAAKAIGLPQEQIEKLAVLLENSGLLEMQYTLTHVNLVSKVFMQEQAEKTEVGKAKVQKDIVVTETRELEKEVLTTENIIEFMKSDMLRRIAKSEGILKQLESTGDFTPAQVQFLRRELDTVLSQLQMFDTEIHKLESKETNFEDRVIQFRERVTLLEKKKAAEPKQFMQEFILFMHLWIEWLKSMVVKEKAQQQQTQQQAQTPAGETVQPEQPHPSIMKMLPWFAKPKQETPAAATAPETPAAPEEPRMLFETTKPAGKQKRAAPAKQKQQTQPQAKAARKQPQQQAKVVRKPQQQEPVKKPSPQSRFLETRKDKVKQHYWRNKRK